MTLIDWDQIKQMFHQYGMSFNMDYENAIFRRKSEYFCLNTDNFTMDLTIL